jgi:peptidoglycan/xylan/chitin deacetylase (PgdA/CDA1 family)/SAM-dependent methyltransferase
MQPVAELSDLPRPRAHAVVIATIGRPSLGAAIRTVPSQSLLPTWLVVCVDSDDKERAGSVTSLLRGLGRPDGLQVHVLPNGRTPGASGAWNTALDWLARRDQDPRELIVSFLDDDDWWEDDHLAAVEAAMAAGAEIVATPIVRHDPESPDGRLLLPPGALCARDFLRGNPGVQGSNLSGRLSTLLEAGLFDEALKSCTDRDLAIRLTDLGARYSPAVTGLVHHDARGEGRLSTAGSPGKREGLTVFRAKHAWRMSDEDRHAFETRARAVFGWSPEDEAPPPAPPPRAPQTSGSMRWVVATIADTTQPERALGLLADLARLSRHPRVTSLSVVALPNGPAEPARALVEASRGAGLSLHLVDEAEQRKAAVALGLAPAELRGHMSIAAARSVLQLVAYELTTNLDRASGAGTEPRRAGAPPDRPVVWVVDDDLRLPSDLDLFVDDVARARAKGMDVAIGMVEGAPPVPAATTLRTQLVDLVSFLTGAAGRSAEEPAPPAEHHNGRWQRGRGDDYYYDLVRRRTDRLETPFLPASGAGDLGTVVRGVVRRAPRMLAGEQIFRPLAPQPGDPIAAAQPSCRRGGNTFVFDLELLRDVPNLSPLVGGRRLRRSDMVWAALCRFARRRDVQQLPIVVRHDRSLEPERGLDPDKLSDDILGYAFARAFEERLRSHEDHAEVMLRELSDATRTAVLQRTRKLARERLAELRLSCFRIRGLGAALLRIADACPTPAGLDREATSELRRFAERVRALFSAEAFEELHRRLLRALDDEGFSEHLTALQRHQRAICAQSVCERVLGRRMDRVLGAGKEGIVLRSGDRAVKVFDLWLEAERAAGVASLGALLARPAPGAFPRLFAVHDREGEPVVVEMEALDGGLYSGGQGAGILALLRALRESGWSHANIHPRNLLCTALGVRIVDVGRSLLPFRRDAEEHAARRALLSMRCAGSPDLDALLRASIEDGSLPELSGVEHVLGALREPDVKQVLDRRVAERVAGKVAGRLDRRVLDFGCGKPRGSLLSVSGASLTVFDPDASLRERWARDAPEIPFLAEDGLLAAAAAGERFDVIVCSLVLCAVDDAAMRAALARIRELCARGAAVLVAVCDPRSVRVERTERHHRLLPGALDEERCFTYTKRIVGAGERVEHHRPMSAYRAAFFDAGLEITAESTVLGIDVDALVPASELVLFELEPRVAIAPSDASPPRVEPAARRAPPLTVLSYHRAPPAGSDDPALPLHAARGMVVSARSFEAQIEAVKRCLVPVSAADVVEASRGQRTLPEGAVWITFDDGYRETLESAVPALVRAGVPATFFVRAPGPRGVPSWAPLDLCYQVLARGAPEPLRHLPLGPARERLLGQPYTIQIHEIAALARSLGVDLSRLSAERLYLSAADCRALLANGLSLGAHGIDHVLWTHLDEASLAREMAVPAAWLDRIAPGDPLVIAYPDAALDARVAVAAARAGYRAGVVLEIDAPSGIDPRYAIRRRIARDDPRWIESLVSEVLGA